MPRAYVTEAALATCASNLSDIIVAMTPKLPFLPPDLLAAYIIYVRPQAFYAVGPIHPPESPLARTFLNGSLGHVPRTSLSVGQISF